MGRAKLPLFSMRAFAARAFQQKPVPAKAGMETFLRRENATKQRLRAPLREAQTKIADDLIDVSDIVSERPLSAEAMVCPGRCPRRGDKGIA